MVARIHMKTRNVADSMAALLRAREAKLRRDQQELQEAGRQVGGGRSVVAGRPAPADCARATVSGGGGTATR